MAQPLARIGSVLHAFKYLAAVGMTTQMAVRGIV